MVVMEMSNTDIPSQWSSWKCQTRTSQVNGRHENVKHAHPKSMVAMEMSNTSLTSVLKYWYSIC